MSRYTLPPHRSMSYQWMLIYVDGCSGIAAGVVSLYYQADQAKSTSSNITNAMLATYVIPISSPPLLS